VNHVNILFITPSLFNRFSILQKKSLLEDCSVKDLIFGGEPFPSFIKEIWKPSMKIRIWNIYGTTECSVWASAHLVEECDFEHTHFGMPLGEPFDRTEMVLRPTSESDIFELWIGGEDRKCLVGSEKEASTYVFFTFVFKFSILLLVYDILAI
jgi:acyl-CoA synthetase